MLKISRVHIDYQKNPVGISEMPQFGWKIASDRRNVIRRRIASNCKRSGVYRACL